ncbi:hypothetical protein MY8738_006338 [Beauveria namnaoensis]
MLPAIARLVLFVAAVSAVSDLKPLSAEIANADLGSAHVRAVDPPAPTGQAQPVDAHGPEFFTISLSILHTAAVTTVHVEGAGSKEPVGGRLAPGTLADNGVTQFIVPRDYYGNIAFNNAEFRADTGDESLLEFSFTNQNGIYTPDIDDNNGQGSCRNPRRHNAIQNPTEFFAPCYRYGGAYTFPADNEANTLNGGLCRDSVGATCCIGNLCREWDDRPR